MGCCSTLRLLLGLAALHQGLLLQVFILAKWWGRVIQPYYQVSCWRRTTSQKLSTTWRLCLWGIAKMISIQYLRAVFFQSNLMTGYELGFAETASSVTSRWRGTMMAPSQGTKGSKTRQHLCHKGVMTATLRRVLHTSFCWCLKQGFFLWSYQQKR